MDTCIDLVKRNGNLHISPKGEFTTETAQALTSLMKKNYPGEGNIFINTSHITEVRPLSQQMFSIMLGYHDLPKKKIYLKGSKGQDICHDEGRVIEIKPRKKGGCGGRCQNCSCGAKKLH